MNDINQIPKANINYLRSSLMIHKFSLLFVFISGIVMIPSQQANSEEIFLKCTGKYEINRGELIKPDWETSYLTINLDGLTSFIDDKGIKREGRTLLRRNSYTITLRDSNNRIQTKYKINGTHGTYFVDYPQQNKTLIGTCQKSRG